jgi:hypothetical protein
MSTYERRAHVRMKPEDLTCGARARLRAGREAAVVNVSAAGALIETPDRLLPGTRVRLEIPAPPGSLVAAGRVIRATVFAVSAEQGVRYRGAVNFDAPLPRDFEATARRG